MKRLILAVVLVLILFALTGCGTAVPDINGMTISQAEASLKAAGFALGSITYDEKSQGAQGSVVAQEPAAAKRTKAGSMVALTVAGPPPVPTPDLSGLDKAKAEAALIAGGLAVGTVTESYDASVAAGIVVTQTPSARTETPRGSSVVLVISRGPEPVAVPSVKGKQEKDATDALKSAGFKVKASKKASTAKRGIVIVQSPSGGKAQPGTTISITVSTGVEMVKVPNISGAMNPDSVLRRAGLKPKGIPIHGPIESDAAGYMEPYRQNPRAGTLVPKGSTVTYHYWWEYG